MQNGLYSAAFATQLGSGHGVIMLEDGRVRGGDSMMFYTGTYQVSGDQFTADIRVNKHAQAPGMQSVFGRDTVNIKVHGRVSGDRAELTGTAAEVPSAQFKAHLARLSD